jgi:hypothetical protein
MTREAFGKVLLNEKKEVAGHCFSYDSNFVKTGSVKDQCVYVCVIKKVLTDLLSASSSCL